MREKNSGTQKNRELAFVIALYIICVIARFIIGCYLKKIHVYADDLFYYQTAQGFARGLGVTVHNVPIRLQKVLYSLFITPAFFIRDDIARCLTIQFLNSIAISSAIFPIWMFSRKMINSKRLRLIICALFLIYPDLCYSQTFVTENLFFPTSLWIAYIYIELLTRENIKRVKCSILLGIFLYFVYITKGSCALFIMPIMMMTAFCDIVIVGTGDKKKERIKKRGIELALIFAAFFISRYIGKLLFVQTPGVGTDIKKTVSDITIMRLLTEIKLYIYMLAVYVVAAGILGVGLPIIYFKHLKKYTKEVFCYAGMALLLVPLITAHYFSVMYGTEEASAHLRYGMYLFPMLLLSLASMSEDVENRITGKLTKLLFFMACLFVALPLVGVYHLSVIDQTLTWYITRVFNSRMWIYKLMVIAIGISVPLLYEKYGNIVLKLFAVFFTFVMISNNILVIKYHYQDYSVDKQEYEELCNIRNFVTDNPESTFLAVYRVPSEACRMIDTFCNEKNMYCIMDWNNEFRNLYEGSEYKEGALKSPEGYDYDIHGIEYILISKELGISVSCDDGEIIDGYGGSLFDMYRIFRPELVPKMIIR